jgi:hypothetical protein
MRTGFNLYIMINWLWEAMCSRRGKWTNRLLAPDWRSLFERNFKVVRFSEKKRQIHPSFDKKRLAADFRMYDLETLSTCSLWVVAIRSKGIEPNITPRPRYIGRPARVQHNSTRLGNAH